jgi:hypothetical protein
MEVTLSLSQGIKLATLLTNGASLGCHIFDMLRYAEDEQITFTVLPSEIDTVKLARTHLEI